MKAIKEIKVKLVNENAKLPERSNPTDAGADLFATFSAVIPKRQSCMMDLGFQMEIPDGYGAFIFARSGLGTRYGIVPRNCVGVIDSKYRGNVAIMIENSSDEDYSITEGDRIAQMVILPIQTPQFVSADELDMSEDRMGGFGSSGK